MPTVPDEHRRNGVPVRGDTVGETDESGTCFSGEDVMREFLGFFALLLVIGFVVSYWKVLLGILVIAAVGAVAWFVLKYLLEQQREARARDAARVQELTQNAAAQHHSYLQGFDHGIYGNYPPVDLDKL